MIPLVLLHGFLGSGESWRRVLDAARVDRSQVFCPDLPGHGAAPAPASFGGAVDVLAAAIESRFAFPVGLAGYSLGGRLALGLLLSFPRLFVAGVLIGAAPGLGPEDRADRAAADSAAAAGLRERGLEDFLAGWRRQPLFASQARLPREVLDEQEAINRGHDPGKLAAALELLSPGRMPDYRPRLAGIAAPVELLVGGEDAKFLALGRQMKEKLPRARLEVVPGAGHNVMLEAPSAVAAALERLAEGERR